MDILETIFKLQKELATVIASERYPRVKEERIPSLATAIIHEAVEVKTHKLEMAEEAYRI